MIRDILSEAIKDIECHQKKVPRVTASKKEQHMVHLNREECEAVFSLIDSISGGNASNVFAWDGKDAIEDPLISACVKIFCECGREIPSNLSLRDKQ